ncbi:MAG: hypothetical protein Kow001_10490 [Acidobacteriota bacterium]
MVLALLAASAAAQDLRTLVYRAPPGGYSGLVGEVSLYGRSHAVVIGIGDYPRLPKLPGATADARAVSKALADHGFEVTLLLDREATRDRITGELGDRLLPRLMPEDRVLVYFAGHGVTVGAGEAAMGYLMPWEGDNERRMATGIAMSELQRIFALYPAKHVMFVADACYSGLALSTRSTGLPTTLSDYLRQVTRKRVRLALTAGAADQEAHEWQGQGLFTYFFVEALRGQGDSNGDGILTSSELYAFLEPNVAQTALANWQARQNPQLGRSGEGEFIFLVPGHPATDPTAPPPPAPGRPSEAAEITFWKSIEQSAHPEDFQAYLDRFPDGIFAELAQLKLARIKASPARPDVGDATLTPSAAEVRETARDVPQTGQAPTATRVLGRAGSPAEASAWEAIRKATAAEEQGRLAEGFLRQYPHSGLAPYAHYLLALLARRNGDVAGFMRHGEQVTAELPNTPDILAYMAFVDAESGRMDQARQRADQALQALAGAVRPQGRSEAEWTAEMDLVRADAHYARGRVLLGEAMAAEGRASSRALEDAIENFTLALRCSPYHQHAAYRLGEACSKGRRFEEAFQHFARAAALGGDIGELGRQRLEELAGYLGRSPRQVEDAVQRERSAVQEALRQRAGGLKSGEQKPAQRPPSLRRKSERPGAR